MQKALTQMNLQIHHVISDITGFSGLAIINAILSGERDPYRLASLRDKRIKASASTIAKSLIGDYRSEHIFALKQSLEIYQHYRKMISDVDLEIKKHLEKFESKVDIEKFPPPEEFSTLSSLLSNLLIGDIGINSYSFSSRSTTINSPNLIVISMFKLFSFAYKKFLSLE